MYYLGNFTTNLAETWMHIRCKFDGGKQINRSQSGSWQACCAGAGLRYNEGAAWGPRTWEHLLSTPPSDIFLNTSMAAVKKLQTIGKEKQLLKPRLAGRKLDTILLTIA